MTRATIRALRARALPLNTSRGAVPPPPLHATLLWKHVPTLVVAQHGMSMFAAAAVRRMAMPTLLPSHFIRRRLPPARLRPAAAAEDEEGGRKVGEGGAVPFSTGRDGSEPSGGRVTNLEGTVTTSGGRVML